MSDIPEGLLIRGDSGAYIRHKGEWVKMQSDKKYDMQHILDDIQTKINKLTDSIHDGKESIQEWEGNIEETRRYIQKYEIEIESSRIAIKKLTENDGR